MWVHECHRVWLDRLLFPEDIAAYNRFMEVGMKELIEFKADEL